MNYLYNERNLLVTPGKYMYTKFQGMDLFQSYLSNRNNVLKKYRENTSESSSSSLIVQKAFNVIKQNLISKSPNALKSFIPHIKQEDAKNINSPFDSNIDLAQMNKLLNNISLGQSVKTSIYHLILILIWHE